MSQDQQPVSQAPQHQPSQVSKPEIDTSNRAKSPFNSTAVQDKKQAVINALRAERGVADPEDVSSEVAPSGQAPASAEAQSTPNQETQETKAQNDILQEYDARLRATMASEASAEQKRVEADRLEKEATDKLARIESAKSDPLMFLAELGITEEQWAKHLQQSADTPEMRRMSQLEKQFQERLDKQAKEFEAYKQETAQARQEELASQARRSAENLLQQESFALSRKMSNADAVLRRQQEMEQHSGQKVSIEDAAKHLEASLKDGISKLFADKDISAMFASKPTSEQSTAEFESPTTLNSVLSSGTTPGQGTPGPLAWEDKRKLAVHKLQEMRRRLEG